MTDPRYPIGEFAYQTPYSEQEIQEKIAQISSLPARLRAEVKDLSTEQLDTPYRDGGWTVRQVVHHVADSHINGYIRVKLALTEDNPSVKSYEEQLWAELPDTFEVPIEASLNILDAIHARWMALYQHMDAAKWQRTFYHPGYQKSYPLIMHLGLYAWHGNHHLAHITTLKNQKNW
jgi:uncharacterized damage-inducible protein DinB